MQDLFSKVAEVQKQAAILDALHRSHHLGGVLGAARRWGTAEQVARAERDLRTAQETLSDFRADLAEYKAE